MFLFVSLPPAATRISESNAICAPLTWQQGDLRRPYPTDIEMRLGFLGKSDHLNINGGPLQHQSSVASGDLHRNSADIPHTAQNQFAWHPASGELHMSMSSNAGSVSLETRYARSGLWQGGVKSNRM